MDIAVGGFVLAIVAFVAGTVTPALYRRLVHSGISIKALGLQVTQPLDGQGVYYALVVKAANASGRSVLLDDVRLKPLVVGGTTYRQRESRLADVTDSKTLLLPTARDKNQRIDVLPLVLKSDDARVYVLESFLVGDGPHPAEFTVDFKTTSVDFRINGIYRNYKVDPSQWQTIVGYSVNVDTSREMFR